MTASAPAFASSSIDGMWHEFSDDGMRMGGQPIGEMEGAPFLRYSMSEVVYVNEHNEIWTLPFDWEFEPVDDGNTFSEDYGNGSAYHWASRTYRYKREPEKTAEVTFWMESLPFGADWSARRGPAIGFYAYVVWPNGAPGGEIQGVNIRDVGMVIRSDHDTMPNNNNGVEVATGPNQALSAARGGDVEGTPMRFPNIPNQPLARMFDTLAKSNYAAGWPVTEIQWLRNWDSANEEYRLNAKLYSEDDGSILFGAKTPPQTEHQPQSYYSDFVGPGEGGDQVVYMQTLKLNPSKTSYETAMVQNLIIKRDGYRSIELRWFYHDPEYGDPDYVVDDGNSVRAVLSSLDEFHSPVYVEPQQTNLTCPGNDCSDAELMDLEYSTNPDWGMDKSVLKTAVYVLEKNQTYPAGGVTFSSRSRGFVFPKMLSNIKPAVYKSIAHEIGHTFKFEHSWGRCKRDDICYLNGTPYNYCCEGGDIMSYSQALAVSQGWDKFDFNYTDDSKMWFNDASWSIVEPYVGGSVGAAFPDDDNGLEPSQVLSR